MIKMENGRSRGMGTVSFYSPEDARRAVRILTAVNGGGNVKIVVVTYLREKYIDSHKTVTLMDAIPCSTFRLVHCSSKSVYFFS